MRIFAQHCRNSGERVKSFVDGFVRCEYLSNWTAEKDGDFINEPERAARCADAAEYGGDGKTHAEAIEDMREAFAAWVADRRTGLSTPERFMAAVEAHFDAVEKWHETNGTLEEVIG